MNLSTAVQNGVDLTIHLLKFPMPPDLLGI